MAQVAYLLGFQTLLAADRARKQIQIFRQGQLANPFEFHI